MPKQIVVDQIAALEFAADELAMYVEEFMKLIDSDQVDDVGKTVAADRVRAALKRYKELEQNG